MIAVDLVTIDLTVNLAVVNQDMDLAAVSMFIYLIAVN